jgi:hypothetical protein
MKQNPAGGPSSSEKIIRDIKRKTRKQYSAEEKKCMSAFNLPRRNQCSCLKSNKLSKVLEQKNVY